MEWTKQPGTTYLQTWHGTPLKRIHHDVPGPAGVAGQARTGTSPAGTCCCSPNPVEHRAAARTRSASAAPVHETGYPRNDVLSRPDRDEVRARVRAELGHPRRDDRGPVRPDLARRPRVRPRRRRATSSSRSTSTDFTERLGDDHVLLLRLHSMVAGRLAIPPGAPVVDVSDRAESAELYLAADMLVTDYSSAMFDFAVTGKPMVFYTYDLEHYRDDAARLLLRSRRGRARPARAHQRRTRRGDRRHRRRRLGTRQTGTPVSGTPSARSRTGTRPTACSTCSSRPATPPGDPPWKGDERADHRPSPDELSARSGPHRGAHGTCIPRSRR